MYKVHVAHNTALPAQRAVVSTSPSVYLTLLRVDGIVNATTCNAAHLFVPVWKQLLLAEETSDLILRLPQGIHNARILHHKIFVFLNAVGKLPAVSRTEG